jgi:predicted Rossmann-fold nucleotide-binding protein
VGPQYADPVQHLSVEIESLAEFDAHLVGATRLAGWLVQSVDLTDRGPALAERDPAGAVFLGCRFDPDTALDLVRRDALVFPELPDVPFNPYRATLYSAAELYDTPRYADSLDAVAYAWFRATGTHADLPHTLAMALHDHAITDALDDLDLDPEHVVGIMGGHNWRRDDQAYLDGALLAAALTERGAVILTGGGPGAMEAANLGARFAGQADRLPAACELLATAPTFTTDIDAWVDTARTVLERWPGDPGMLTLGVPTWHYGHEPPNPFASHIAKYFTNALREDTLLRRCDGGIICLPGAAGTIQEIFQATTENYYAAEGAPLTPMILVGREYWTKRLPAWQLLSTLAQGRRIADVIHLVDSMAEAPALLSVPR